MPSGPERENSHQQTRQSLSSTSQQTDPSSALSTTAPAPTPSSLEQTRPAMNATLPPLRIPQNFDPHVQNRLPATLEPRSLVPSPQPLYSGYEGSRPPSNIAPYRPPEISASGPARHHDEVLSAAESQRRSSYLSSSSYGPNPSATSASSQLPSSQNFMQQLPPGERFQLIVRQQAEVARACGFGERDRRVLDPPPILECVGPIQKYLDRGEDEAMGPTFIAHAALWNAEGTEDVTTSLSPNGQTVRLLVGQLVSSAAAVRDDEGRRGLFFTFADLSCRSSGRYRLRFSLLQIDPSNTAPGVSAPILDNIMSEPFDVYTAKDFPGMRRATPLTRVLKEQGVPIPAKKSRIEEPTRRAR